MIAARSITTAAILAAAVAAATAPSAAQQTEVRAVLFFSPTCPHCHVVMEQHLPPLLDRFGERLQVITINAATPDGGRMYQDMVEAYGVPRSRLGVPALVVGRRVLVGADEIPQLLPGIVTTALAEGGIDWPAVPSIRAALARAGLLEPLPAPRGAAAAARPAPGDAAAAARPAPGNAAAAARPAPESAQAAGQPATLPAPGQPSHAAASAARYVAADPDALPRPDAPKAAGATADGSGPAADPGRPGGQTLRDVTDSAAPATMSQRFMRDPIANAVAVAVLVGLLLVSGWSVNTVRSGARMGGHVPVWLVPALVVSGLGVAGYLSYIEVTGTTAVCGPVGDCNTVQQSPYATLFGFLPIGVLGLLGYAGLGGVWALGRRGPTRQRQTATTVLWLAALAGTAFSAYLTFLEPFVIGASCAWCLTSAAITAVILMAATTDLAQRRTAAAVPSRRPPASRRRRGTAQGV
jgi:uncharacterized membrane protein/thiol-disulfide isomerase/thioredoxin